MRDTESAERQEEVAVGGLACSFPNPVEYFRAIAVLRACSRTAASPVRALIASLFNPCTEPRDDKSEVPVLAGIQRKNACAEVGCGPGARTRSRQGDSNRLDT